MSKTFLCLEKSVKLAKSHFRVQEERYTLELTKMEEESLDLKSLL